MEKINCCRICEDKNLIQVFDLGNQYLTGIFPNNQLEIENYCFPVELLMCKNCGLVQLAYNYDLELMYGEGYGYRSSLNPSMVGHLKSKNFKLQKIISLDASDLVIDIGANDGTFLNFYPKGVRRIGVDPSSEYFSSILPKDIQFKFEFFSKEIAEKIVLENNQKAKIITSISMFYDLPDPRNFVSGIQTLLDSEGIWHLEQSYLPLMLEKNSYDTICHEHLEYYSIEVIENLITPFNLRIIDIELNDINGGSFALTVAHNDSRFNISQNVPLYKEKEYKYRLREKSTYKRFEENCIKQKNELQSLLSTLKKDGHSVYGYGASTKGNVTLQYCNLTSSDLDCILEVNESKFGKVTPGTNIPIKNEKEFKKEVDYYLILPWHFKDFIISKEKEFLKNGGKLIIPFPFPYIIED